MCRFAVIALFFLVYEQTVFSATVDQRQTGDLNVQIDLKNLQIVGLMKGKEEYVDYDYAYDYSEMTIKPPSGTTKKPLNVTESMFTDKDNATVATTVYHAEIDQTTSSIENGSNETMVNTTPKIGSNDASSMINNNTTPTVSPDTTGSNSTITNCKKGFYRNSKGSCELKLQNPSNALLKMIKQKSKLNGSHGVRQS